MPTNVQKSKRKIRGFLQTTNLEPQVIGLTQSEADLLIEVIEVYNDLHSQEERNPHIINLYQRLLAAEPERIH